MMRCPDVLKTFETSVLRCPGGCFGCHFLVSLGMKGVGILMDSIDFQWFPNLELCKSGRSNLVGPSKSQATNSILFFGAGSKSRCLTDPGPYQNSGHINTTK